MSRIENNLDVMRENQEKTMIKQDKSHRKLDTIIHTQEELKRNNENIYEQMRRSIGMTRSILRNMEAPKYFVVVPDGFFYEQIFDGSALVKRKATLYFVCPVTFSVPRDSDGNPMGYDLELERGWVEKFRPALYVSLMVLNFAYSVGSFSGPELPDKSVFEMIAEKVVFREDDEALLDPVGELEKYPQLRDLAKHSYEEVKRFAHEKNDEEFLKSGLSRVVSEKDDTVEYVLNDPRIKALYAKEGKNCLGLSLNELREKKADMHKIVLEGALEKKSKKGSFWKPRYFVLRKDGLLTYYASKEDRNEDSRGVKGKVVPERVVNIHDKNSKDGDLIEIEYADKTKRDFKIPRGANAPTKDEWFKAGRSIRPAAKK